MSTLAYFGNRVTLQHHLLSETEKMIIYSQIDLKHYVTILYNFLFINDKDLIPPLENCQ